MQEFKGFSQKLLRYNTESVTNQTFWMNGVGCNKPGKPLLWYSYPIAYFAVDTDRFVASITENTGLSQVQKQAWEKSIPHFRNAGVVFLPKTPTVNLIPIYEMECQRVRGGLVNTIDDFLGLIWLSESKENCTSWANSCKEIAADHDITENKFLRPRKEQIQELVELTKLTICLRD